MVIEEIQGWRGFWENQDARIGTAIVSLDERLVPGDTVTYRPDPRGDNLSDGALPGAFVLADGTEIPARRELFLKRHPGQHIADALDEAGLDESALLP